MNKLSLFINENQAYIVLGLVVLFNSYLLIKRHQFRQLVNTVEEAIPKENKIRFINGLYFKLVHERLDPCHFHYYNVFKEDKDNEALENIYKICGHSLSKVLEVLLVLLSREALKKSTEDKNIRLLVRGKIFKKKGYYLFYIKGGNGGCNYFKSDLLDGKGYNTDPIMIKTLPTGVKEEEVEVIKNKMTFKSITDIIFKGESDIDRRNFYGAPIYLHLYYNDKSGEMIYAEKI